MSCAHRVLHLGTVDDPSRKYKGLRLHGSQGQGERSSCLSRNTATAGNHWLILLLSGKDRNGGTTKRGAELLELPDTCHVSLNRPHGDKELMRCLTLC